MSTFSRTLLRALLVLGSTALLGQTCQFTSPTFSPRQAAQLCSSVPKVTAIQPQDTNEVNSTSTYPPQWINLALPSSSKQLVTFVTIDYYASKVKRYQVNISKQASVSGTKKTVVDLYTYENDPCQAEFHIGSPSGKNISALEIQYSKGCFKDPDRASIFVHIAAITFYQ